MQEDFSTRGSRLRWAIEHRPAKGRRRGVRLFEKDMKARSVARQQSGGSRIEGVSLPSIQSYLPIDGRAAQVDATVDFWEEAASLCGVPAAWLLCGSGHPTDGHAVVANVAAATQSDATDDQRRIAALVRDSILRVLGRSQVDARIPHWVLPVAEIRLRLVLSGAFDWLGADDPLGMGDWRRKIIDGTPADAFIEAAIAHALHAPIVALRLNPKAIDDTALGDYIACMIPALLRLAEEAKRQSQNGTLPDEAPGEMQEVAQEAAITESPKKRTRRSKS